MWLLLVLTLFAAASAGAQPGPFDIAAEELASPDPEVRVRALRQIARSGHPGAAETIAALARDAEDEIQLEAIGTTLALMLDQEPADSRRRAGDAGALGALEGGLAPVVLSPSSVFPHLAAAMGDLNPEVRRHAAAAFAVLAWPGAEGPSSETMAPAERALVVMLGAREPEVRITAARVAGRLYRTPPVGVAPARPLPAEVGDALIALLNQPAQLERLVAMEALGRTGEVRAVASLIERYTYHRASGPPLEMAAALDAVARIGHTAGMSFFVAALADRWDAVRQIGYEGLARVAAPGAAAAVVAGRATDGRANVALAQAFARQRLLADGSVERIIGGLQSARTREQARGYLLELGPGATSVLARALSHRDAAVRATLANVLGRIGTVDALAALESLISDRDRAVVEEAARAVRRIEAGLSACTAPPQ